ncbi:DUF393 domain-containing protein [Akkermansiaceae bacterium]|nr:DUF393 domain-containing protein [Akkermansiaceae bacterium]
MSEEGKALVFYDGSCGFCVRSVALVKHLDVAGRLSYLSLEEGKGRGFEFEEGTMAVVRDGETFLRSEAVRVLLWECGGGRKAWLDYSPAHSAPSPGMGLPADRKEPLPPDGQSRKSEAGHLRVLVLRSLRIEGVTETIA